MEGIRSIVTIAGLILSSFVVVAIAQERVEQGQFARAQSPVVLNGHLDDFAWSSAIPVTQFFEVYPANAGTPTVRTEARFLYDGKSLYIAVQADDPNPAAIRSGLVKRDQVLDDQDFIELLIDPTNARQSALLFRVNAKGVLTDGQFNEQTQLRDYTVDLDFDAHAMIDRNGWAAQFRIPLSTLRYQSGDHQAWSIIIIRNVPREKTVTIASAPIPRKANCTLCFAGKIGGLSLPAARDPLQFAPYATFSRNDATDGATRSTSRNGRVGFDAKWQPTSDTVLDLTVSPDFSQVEADDLQLTANTRFALSVTEKRPFFLESADLLSTASGINAIYTRAFTTPDAGARVTHRGDTLEYSALLVRDAGGASVVEPGPIRSQLAPQDFASTAFAGRIRLHEGDVTWGGLATARVNEDGSHNIVYGTDAVWAPTAADRFSAQLLGSGTQNPDRPDLLPGWNGQSLEGAAAALSWTHSNTNWYADAYFRTYSSGFRAWNGFVPQVGVSYALADAGLNFYPHSSFLVRISPLFTAYHIQEIGAGELGKYLAPGLLLEGPGNTALSLSWYPRFEEITLAGLRTYHYVSVSLIGSPVRWTPQMILTASVGQGVDATTGEIGDGLSVQATIPVRLFDRFELRPSIAYQSLNSRRSDLERKRLFTEVDTQADVLWHFSTRCYLEALYQRARLTGPPQTAAVPFESRSVSTLSSFLLSYQTNWETRFYAGFRRGAGQLDGPFATAGNQTELFAKLTYAIMK